MRRGWQGRSHPRDTLPEPLRAAADSLGARRSVRSDAQWRLAGRIIGEPTVLDFAAVDVPGGVRYRAVGASVLLRDNLLVYGVGGIIAPFIGIKAIDMVLVALGLA